MLQNRVPRYCTFVVGVAVALTSSPSLAQEPPRRIEVGLAARFMPTGWFEWSGRTWTAETELGAYPALGGALFVDYRLNPVVSIGIMPELTLNVIPRTTSYPVSAMVAGSLRLKVEYPGLRVLVPYALLAPGYASMSAYNGSCGNCGGDAHGFVLGAYGGLRIPIGTRHSAFAEGGYQRGFQKRDGSSYVVLAVGWQVSI